jgi:PAS domain S-box-containing protein
MNLTINILMRKTPEITTRKQSGTSERSAAAAADHLLQHLAFDNSLQANMITIVSNGKIIIVNSAACKLLGYSKKELLTKNRSAIFNIKESSFKKMLKQRTDEGHSKAMVTAIKKSGKSLPCEITSAVFMDEDGIEKAITTITDMSQSILKQKNIDTKKEKIVADNIVLAKSKQKEIDIKKEKIVADNIVLAKSEQKEIDIKNEKIVAENIILAQAKSDARLAENNEWIRYIAKTSYDVMWDWDIITGKIYVGDSIKEVFGYNVQNNTVYFAEFTQCLLPEEKDAVEKKLLKTLTAGKKIWNDSFMFKRRDDSIASITSRASIVRDEEGKAIRLIGAIQDVSRLQELEKKLEEQITGPEELSEIFLMAAKISFDVIWDWNLLTNEMFIGEGFEELFGYAIQNNKGHFAADWGNHLHPYDKEAVEKGLRNAIASSDSHWEHAYRFIRADASSAKVFNRGTIIRHADGTAYRMIGAMQDITRQKELEEKLDHEIAINGKLLSEYKESFKFIFNASSDVFYDSDLIANEIIISDAYEKEFGYKITPHMTPAADWISHIHPEDKETVIRDYLRMLASDVAEWKYSYRFLRANDSIANVLTRGIVLRNAGGKAYRMIGYMQDMSKQKVLEEKLEQEIKLKEKQIAEATEQAKETERSDLGKELHDNVNQLLGASRMYLEMAKRGGEDSEMFLNRSSQYTLTAIEEIRKLTRGLTTDIITNLGLCAAIDDVARDTMEVNPIKISCSLASFIEHSVNNKFKLNVFRIVQEQLNNILKHAKATEVTINLSQHKQSISLSISDNGVGFDTSQKRKGIGVDNIKSRATSYDGTADFVSQPGKGCVLTVTFPVTDALMNKN